MAQPIIPGYTIAERIGSGGFASVYLATHDETGHDVAIKVLHDHTSNGADLLRFERERTTMRALNGHPNIVAILDAGTTDDERHFTVLEYVGGGSVRDRIAEGGALHWANVVEIGVQICAALDVAHRSGVLHRDVKPANILLEESTAKLGDFGIARLIGQSQVTAAQSIIGTLAYTPPEVFHNKPFDGRGDIYQLGITLYEMLLGRAPFTSAAADNKATIIRRILDNPAPPLAQFDVPLPLSNLLDEVLAKDPADRPQTAESFGRRLNEVEDALGRTPTSIGEPTESISIETTTLGNTSETGEHDVSVWPAGAEAVVVETTDAVPPLSTVVAAETPMGDRVAAAVAPDAPLAPEVDPPFDANVTVAEPRPADPTAVHASSGAAPMSLGTPGPAPAHFDEPPKRRTQDRPASAVKPKPRRWPLALLLVGLIGAGAAGVIAARLSDNNSGTEDDSSVETTTDDTSNDVVESAPQFAPLEDAAFLEPDVAHAVIFDVVRNSSGLTMVGGAGDGESTDVQRPVIWTIGSGQTRMQREIEQGGRLFAVGVSRSDFLAVGDTQGPGGTDGLAFMGGAAAQFDEVDDSSFAGGSADALRASTLDPTISPEGFLVGGSQSTNGAATMALWSVARPSKDDPPVWNAIPLDVSSAGTINDIAANDQIAVAVGTEKMGSIDTGIILIRRGDGGWDNLIRPLENTIFHSVTIAGDRIVVVGENEGRPVAIVSNETGEPPWLHRLPIRTQRGTARDVAVVSDGRIVAVGDVSDAESSSDRDGAIWELLPGPDAGDFASDNWTTRVSSDLQTDTFTELHAIADLDDTIYVFGRTEIDDRRPAGAWTLDLDGSAQ